MGKIILTLTLTIIICIIAGPGSVFAAGKINTTYSNGSVTVSGEGFDPNTEYSIRIINSDGHFLIAMSNVWSDANGNIVDTEISVGALENGTFDLFADDAATGTTAVTSELHISGNSGSGGSAGGGSWSSTGGGSGSGSSGSGGGSESGSGSGTGSGSGSDSGSGTEGGSNYSAGGDSFGATGDGYDAVGNGDFIGNVDTQDEAAPSSVAAQTSASNKSLQGSEFGKVPQTDVLDIAPKAAAMCALSAISAALWVCILRWYISAGSNHG